MEVYVQVLDENDNNPYFVSNVSNVSVMENSKTGTEIAVIQARDPDSGDYGKITYLLDRMSSQVKSANSETHDNHIIIIDKKFPLIHSTKY